jgi:predicted Zn-dependent protease
MKAVVRLSLLVSGFVLSWFLLAQVDWRERLSIEELSQDSEEKLSEFIKKQIERSEEVIKDKDIIRTIDSLVQIIVSANTIDGEDIKIIVVNNQEVNAFALPKAYMVINSGLIAACKSPEALSGVIAHELSHIQLKHVERKLLKELGVAVLLSSTAGGGAEVMKQVIKTLSGTAYDRSLEQEADESAVRYLINAQIDPEPLAAFFYDLSLSEPDIMSNLEWIATHESSKERAENIVALIENEIFDKRPVIHPATWAQLQQAINALATSAD